MSRGWIAALALLVSGCAYNYRVGVDEGASDADVAHVEFSNRIKLARVDGKPFKTRRSPWVEGSHSFVIAPGTHSFTVRYDAVSLNGGVYSEDFVTLSAPMAAGHYYEIVYDVDMDGWFAKTGTVQYRIQERPPDPVELRRQRKARAQASVDSGVAQATTGRELVAATGAAPAPSPAVPEVAVAAPATPADPPAVVAAVTPAASGKPAPVSARDFWFASGKLQTEPTLVATYAELCAFRVPEFTESAPKAASSWQARNQDAIAVTEQAVLQRLRKESRGRQDVADKLEFLHEIEKDTIASVRKDLSDMPVEELRETCLSFLDRVTDESWDLANRYSEELLMMRSEP